MSNTESKPAPEESPQSPEVEATSKAYLDIVWLQFKKNRAAYYALWALLPTFLLATFAPVIASNQPFIYFDGNETIYPWFHALFNPEEPSDYIFNMALLGFFPWLVIALVTNYIARLRGVPGRRRLGIALLELLVTVVGLCYLFWSKRPIYSPLQFSWWGHLTILGGTLTLWGFLSSGTVRRQRDLAHSTLRAGFYVVLQCLLLLVAVYAVLAIPNVKPNNKYRARAFAEEEFQAQLEFGESNTIYGIYAPIPFGPLEGDQNSHNKPPLHQNDSNLMETNDGVIHLLGTEDIGTDMLTRMIYGTRISMTVGFLAVSIYLFIGTILGAVAGYFGGKIDMLISRVIEVVMLFPSFFLIITIVAMLGPSIYIIMFVIGITGWPRIARLIRGEVLKQRAIDYTSAARALGASHTRVIFRHILPNALSPVLVSAPFGVASAIIVEAGLSLLGFGVRPPTPSWGTTLRQGMDNYQYWWLIIFPSLAIFLTVTIFNLVGSGLRDAMDPRLRV